MLHYNFFKSQNDSKQLLVMLHGFISDSTTYDSHIEQLSQHVNVLTIDLPGHGKDTSDMNDTWDFPYIAHALDEVLSQYDMYDVYLLGYSMGGRVALYYALNGSVALRGLLLESTSAGIQSEADKVERVQVDAARAKVLEIAGLEIFVNDWEKLPLFRSQYELDAEVRKAIRANRMSQNPVRLAKALRDYGTGNMPNLWPQVSSLRVRTLILTGEKDEKFVQIGQKLKEEIPNSRTVQVSDVGHTIHVEDSAEFDTIILGFLKEEQND